MVERSRVHAALTVRGPDLDPNLVSEMLGVGPTHSTKKGQIRGPGASPLTYGTWTIDRRIDDLFDLDRTVRSILEEVTRSDAWTAVTEMFEVELTLVFYLYQANDGAQLELQTMEMLAQSGVRLGFDLYSLAAFEPEAESHVA